MSESLANALVGLISVGCEIEALASEQSPGGRPFEPDSPLETAAAFFAGLVALARAVEKHAALAATEPSPVSPRTGDESWLR